MGDLALGTPVKTLRTDRDTLEQRWDMGGLVVREDPEDEYEAYIISWKDYPEGSMLREEVEPLTEDEKMNLVAQYVMET